MRSTAVSKLKATLSEQLARVKAGEEVIVTERGKPIAKIVPMGQASGQSAHMLELARAGLVRIGTGKLPTKFWKLSRPQDKRGLGLKSLLDERADGR